MKNKIFAMLEERLGERNREILPKIAYQTLQETKTTQEQPADNIQPQKNPAAVAPVVLED